MRIAVTGATGFVGTRLVDAAAGAGFSVRALTRRPQPPRDGVAWVAGALGDADALATLVDGTDAVIHVAGTVNAPDAAGFHAGNVAGTAAILAAAGERRLVHVSSLAAREPGLSQYGASKAEAEALIRASAAAWTILRPPAIYGPGDRDMLELFRLARRGLAFTPPAGRMSAIHVDDLSELLLALAAAPGDARVYEADDGTPGGWSHADFARAVGTAVGRRVRPVALPAALLRLVARGDRIVRGDAARLTPDRVAYFCHPDWTIDPARRPDPALWAPRIATPDGLADTARWYRANALL